MSMVIWLHVCLCTTFVPEGSIEPPGIGLYKLLSVPCGYWESNPGPLEEQLVFLTAQPSLQPH